MASKEWHLQKRSLQTGSGEPNFCTPSLTGSRYQMDGGRARWRRSPQADLVAMVPSVDTYLKLHFNSMVSATTHTLPELLGAFEVQLTGAPHAVRAIEEGQIVHQEAFLLQQIGFELAMLVTSAWIEICRLRCALQRGHGPRDEVTDITCHLTNRLAATLSDSCPFSLASKS